MNRYTASSPWQRVALGMMSGATALAVLASALLLFSDNDDRGWMAAALGLGGGVADCRDAVPADGRCATRLAKAAAPSSAGAAGAAAAAAIDPR